MKRLAAVTDIPHGPVTRPAYARERHGIGIVHLGAGAFMRAHIAVYTDDAIAARGGDWRIMGVSLRSPEIADRLNPQDGLYTLIERASEAPRYRVVGAVAGALFAPGAHDEVMALMTAPATRIVSLTVTEKGYGLSPRTGGLDHAHAAIAADLADGLARPQSAIGLITAALSARRDAGVGPFTVMSCDNLPHNGAMARRLTLETAQSVAPTLADWIAAHVTFPSTMVDRITPVAKPETHAEIAQILGCEDRAATETEPFSQWVIEDAFCAGRPAWEEGGALLVDGDVSPYEKMKLRMLNGSHSMLAYTGFLLGHRHVRDVMADPDLALLVAAHMRAAAATLPPVPGIDLAAYAKDLCARLANPAMADETYRIAMDGTQKLPPRIFEPAIEARARGQSLAPFAFATAAWMTYALGRKPDGERYALRDPRETEIKTILENAGRAPRALAAGLSDLPGFIPASLAADSEWRAALESALVLFLDQGPRAAVRGRAKTL